MTHNHLSRIKNSSLPLLCSLASSSLRIPWVGDLLVGLIGAFLGGLILDLLVPDATFGFWGSLIVAVIGACILVAIVHAVQGRRTGTRL